MIDRGGQSVAPFESRNPQFGPRWIQGPFFNPAFQKSSIQAVRESTSARKLCTDCSLSFNDLLLLNIIYQMMKLRGTTYAAVLLHPA
jgi:hypothetical protein